MKKLLIGVLSLLVLTIPLSAGADILYFPDAGIPVSEFVAGFGEYITDFEEVPAPEGMIGFDLKGFDLSHYSSFLRSNVRDIEEATYNGYTNMSPRQMIMDGLYAIRVETSDLNLLLVEDIYVGRNLLYASQDKRFSEDAVFSFPLADDVFTFELYTFRSPESLTLAETDIDVSGLSFGESLEVEFTPDVGIPPFTVKFTKEELTRNTPLSERTFDPFTIYVPDPGIPQSELELKTAGTRLEDGKTVSDSRVLATHEYEILAAPAGVLAYEIRPDVSQNKEGYDYYFDAITIGAENKETYPKSVIGTYQQGGFDELFLFGIDLAHGTDVTGKTGPIYQMTATAYNPSNLGADDTLNRILMAADNADQPVPQDDEGMVYYVAPEDHVLMMYPWSNLDESSDYQAFRSTGIKAYHNGEFVPLDIGETTPIQFHSSTSGSSYLASFDITKVLDVRSSETVLPADEDMSKDPADETGEESDETEDGIVDETVEEAQSASVDETDTTAFIGTAVATEGGVNLRTKPNTDGAVVARTSANQAFNVVEQDAKTSWYLVELEDGNTAWISNKKVTFTPTK